MASKKMTSRRLERGLTALMNNEAERKTSQEQTKLAKQCLEWMKQRAIETVKRGRNYDHTRGHHAGDIMRGLGLGEHWDSRDKEYGRVIRAMKRAEELGFVEVHRNGSPMRFKYIGPEVEEAQKSAEAERKAEVDDLKRLAKKLRLKGVNVHKDKYGDNDPYITLTPAAFRKVAEKAGVA